MSYTLWGVIIYLVATVAIAWFYGRSKDDEDYLIAERNLGFWSSAMTIISSKIGAGFIISIMAFVYMMGAIALFAFIGVFIGYLIFIPFARYLKKMADKHKFYTLPEFYRYQYGAIAGLVMSVIMFAAMEISVMTQLIGGAHVVSDTSSIPYNWSVLVIAAIVLFYLVLGGFRSVVATDFLQGLCLLGLVPILLLITIVSIGDISVIDLSMSKEGIKNIPNFIIVGITIPFATPELWQRVYAIKDIRTVTKTLIGTSIMYSIFGLLLTLMALYFTAILGEIVPETLLVAGFEKVLPASIAALGIVFLLSAIFSSFDTYVFTAAAILVQDILKRNGPEHKGKSAVLGLRVWQIVLIVLAVIFSILLPNIIDTTLLVLGLYAVAGIVGVAAAIRKTKLANPAVPLMIGFGGMIYGMLTTGLTTNLVSYGALGAFVGLFLNGIYTRFSNN